MVKKNQSPSIINGSIHQDERGILFHANKFNLSEIKRMYHIHQIDMDVIRAWQGHRIEQKWFHCIKGAFKIQFVEIDNWDSPSQNCEIHSMELSEEKCQVLHVPGGYANGFKALKANSILMVFSNQTINEAKNDDFRFDNNYWNLSWD